MNKNIPNKANFINAKNAYNFSNNNDYEQKTTNYELSKTKPIQTQTKPILKGRKSEKRRIKGFARLRQVFGGTGGWEKMEKG